MTKYLPRMAAVHDLSGYGKCALTVVLPVLSAAGVEVCPLPTAVFSTNTLFKNYTFLDFSSHMSEYIDHWLRLGLKFDSVYSGFLGSPNQVQMVKRLINEFDHGISIVDPVMGDNGKIISIYNQQMISEMRNLVAVADLVTPNLTEASLLLDQEYKSAELDCSGSRKMCDQILSLGAKSIILTGIRRGDRLYNCAVDVKGNYFEVPIDMLPCYMHGTGDLFTSVVAGGLLRGYDLQTSVTSATDFVYDVMVYSLDVDDIFDRGVAFEPFAHKLGSGIYQREQE